MQFYLAITSFELGWKKQNKINTFDFPLLVKWDRLTISAPFTEAPYLIKATWIICHKSFHQRHRSTKV